jgi:uncharacterized membrane protein
MFGRMWIVWHRVRDSLWFLPSLLTVLATLLAFAMTSAEMDGLVSLEMQLWWVFGGGVEGARGVLSAIAGGLITVTGVVFSITIVSLQLASSQFTPRVLRNFMADRGNQTVLGVFIGTFTYTLLVLRTIRSASDDGESFVPRLAVTIALVLVLVSIGFLIFFINHVANSIHVSTILERVSHRAVRDVERLFPEPVGEEDDSPHPDPRGANLDSAPIRAAGAGYLQGVDGDQLFELGKDRRVVIAMQPHVGDFVVPGQVLATVWPRDVVDEQSASQIRKAFAVGPRRTPGQDVEFGILEISDIAVKALSPGINDPTTAAHCIDRLTQILLALGTRSPPRAARTREGRVHFLSRHTSFDRAMGVAFDGIRHFGASNPGVMLKLLENLAVLRGLVYGSRRATVVSYAGSVRRAARRQIEDSEDLARVEAAASHFPGLTEARDAPRGDAG